MQYDPIKDALGRLFGRHPLLQRLFFTLLGLFFLRAWYVKREVRQLFDGLNTRPTLYILDAGTGFGQYAYYIAKRYPQARVLAVDVKQDYLDNARRFFDRTPQADQVELALEDLTELKAEGPFDMILSVDVMEHIENDRAVFRNFARVLRQGGFVLINTPSDLGGSDVKEDHDSGFIDEHVRDGYNLEALKTKLREAHIKPVRTLYTYGRFGSLAWRLLIKFPMQMLSMSRWLIFLLPIYYLPVLPVGLLLNALDMRFDNQKGSGLIVIGTKV